MARDILEDMANVGKRRVLVTGAAGFIGSHLVDALLERGDEVRGIDDLSTGTRQNLAAVHDRIQFFEGSILDRHLIAQACEGVDVVFHQAAIPSVPRSVADPRTSHCANLDGTFEVLEAARTAGVRRVIYAASSSAYGDGPGLPRVETMLPHPVSPYAVQKLAGEFYLRSFAAVFGMETVSLRYFNIFGPRQRGDSPYSGVMAKFAASMLAGQQTVIFGDGEQTRDFTYISNAVDANVMASIADAERVSGRVFNVGCGEQHSLLELHSMMEAILRSGSMPAFAPPRAGDVRDSLASIDAAREAFGYHPRVSFADGVRRTCEWYAQQWNPTMDNPTDRSNPLSRNVVE